MSRILPVDYINRQRDMALHYDSSPRNLENNWNGLWIKIFFMLEEGIPLASRRLSLHPQFPLIQWAVVRINSLPLSLEKREQPELREEVVDNPTGIHLQPLELMNADHKFIGTQKRGSRGSSRHLATSSLLGLFQQTSEPSATTPSTSPSTNSTARTYAPQVGSTCDVITLIDPGTPTKYPPPGLITGTITAKDLDSSFYLDFALYEIHTITEDGESRDSFDHTIYPRTIRLPIIMELKRVPSRKFQTTLDIWFRLHLSSRISEAYGDVHKKAPVIFVEHPTQKSVIALALVGFWWSFSLIRRGDAHVVWSKIYTCGESQHDNLLRNLYAAAHAHPEDPSQHKGGWIRSTLHGQKRVDYNYDDCLATSVPNVPTSE